MHTVELLTPTLIQTPVVHPRDSQNLCYCQPLRGASDWCYWVNYKSIIWVTKNTSSWREKGLRKKEKMPKGGLGSEPFLGIRVLFWSVPVNWALAAVFLWRTFRAKAMATVEGVRLQSAMLWIPKYTDSHQERRVSQKNNPSYKSCDSTIDFKASCNIWRKLIAQKGAQYVLSCFNS